MSEPNPQRKKVSPPRRAKENDKPTQHPGPPKSNPDTSKLTPYVKPKKKIIKKK